MKGRVIHMKYQKHKRVKYFRKQKILGGLILALGILSAILLAGDITVALLLIPLGLYIVFTKKPVLMDDYFYELEAKKFDKWKEP